MGAQNPFFQSQLFPTNQNQQLQALQSGPTAALANLVGQSNIGNLQDPGLPSGLQAQLMLNNALGNQAMRSGTFQQRHSGLMGAGGALLGGLLGAAAGGQADRPIMGTALGALMGLSAANAGNQRRRQQQFQNLQALQEQALAQFKAMEEFRAGRADALTGQNVLQSMGVNPGTIAPLTSGETTRDVMAGFGSGNVPSQIGRAAGGLGRARQSLPQAQVLNLPGIQTTGGPGGPQMESYPSVGERAMAPLNASASATNQVNVPPPSFVTPTTMNAAINALASVTNNEQTNRTDVTRLPSQIQADLALAEYRIQNARSEEELRDARKQLLQAQAAANQSLSGLRDRTDPNIRSGGGGDYLGDLKKQAALYQDQYDAADTALFNSGYLTDNNQVNYNAVPQAQRAAIQQLDAQRQQAYQRLMQLNPQAVMGGGGAMPGAMMQGVPTQGRDPGVDRQQMQDVSLEDVIINPSNGGRPIKINWSNQ